jgi:hypothetical protein
VNRYGAKHGIEPRETIPDDFPSMGGINHQIILMIYYCFVNINITWQLENGVPPDLDVNWSRTDR